MFDVGFQLSFLVLLGLLLGAGPLARLSYLPLRPDVFIPRKRLPRWRLWIDGIAAKSCLLFSASLVAWVSSLPLIFTHFRLVAPITVLSNFLVVPIAGFVVVLALLAVLLSPFSLPAAGLLNFFNAKLLAYMTWVLGGLATVPGGHFYVSQDAPPQVEGYKMTLLSADRSAPVIFQSHKETVLIGPGSARAWEFIINPARKYLGIEKWDRLWVLQGNSRYFGGWFDLARMTPVESGYRFPHPAPTSAWRRWNADRSNKEKAWGKLIPMIRGDEVILDGGTRIQCWWPPEEETDWDTENEGLILSIHRLGKTLLLAGNAGGSLEDHIIGEPFPGQVDVLIQGPHSKERNLSLPWLKKLAPEVIVRPASGFYPEMDFTMEKRNVLRRLGTRLIEMEKSGPLQIRVCPDQVKWLFWDGEAKELKEFQP
jgi:beta-lactamase superfamily II metal-dependent hydrolase